MKRNNVKKKEWYHMMQNWHILSIQLKKKKKDISSLCFVWLWCFSEILLFFPGTFFLANSKRDQNQICYRQAANTGLRLIRGRERREEKEKVKGDKSKKEIEDWKYAPHGGLQWWQKEFIVLQTWKNILLKWISVKAYFIQTHSLFVAGTMVPVWPTGIL